MTAKEIKAMQYETYLLVELIAIMATRIRLTDKGQLTFSKQLMEPIKVKAGEAAEKIKWIL